MPPATDDLKRADDLILSGVLQNAEIRLIFSVCLLAVRVGVQFLPAVRADSDLVVRSRF